MSKANANRIRAPLGLKTDETWHAIARELGRDWRWTRRLKPGDQLSEWCGWLQGPDGLRLWVRLDQERWQVHQSLDSEITGTGELIYVPNLYTIGEAKPTMEITLARHRPTTALAREVERRLLPGMRESLVRVDRYRRRRLDEIARREDALDAIRRLCPEVHRFDERGSALCLSLAPTLMLDLRIHDIDNITITRWSGLTLETTLCLIRVAVPVVRADTTRGGSELGRAINSEGTTMNLSLSRSLKP